MAAEVGRQAPSLIERLLSEPHRFEFVQAVRLLERNAASRRPTDEARFAATEEDVVRFRASLALAFPLAEIEDLRRADAGDTFEMEVSFLGLNGPSGVLPRHYSELVIQQLRQKNLAFRDFLDLLNHRAVAMHLSASRKYRLAIGVEQARQDGNDPVTDALYALIGLGTSGLRDRLAVEDNTLIYYGGLFAQKTGSAMGLQQMMSDYLGRPVEVIQFAGRWAPLAQEDWTRLSTPGRPSGNFARLGVDAVAGTHVWDVQGGFRLRLGPLDYRQFAELMPGSPLMNEIAALTRSYAGPELAFDVELVISGDAVPDCALAESGDFLPRLGWNTWLHAETRPAAVSDAVLRFTQI
ncbi:MAG TPA: type VI secretion system baseplate subunit TssG [Stellaceae bacterium]|nr:type VI secretion system baseplate subunit TssG [Stellaceae bacterium]